MSTLHEQLLAAASWAAAYAPSTAEVTLRAAVARHEPIVEPYGVVCPTCRHPWGDLVEAPCDEIKSIAESLGVPTGDQT